MSGRMESAGRRRIGSLLTAGTIGALVLTGAAACASSGTAASSSDTSSLPVSAGSSAGMGVQSTGSPSASASASSSAASGASSSSAPAGAGSTTTSGTATTPSVGGVVVSPKAQVSSTPTTKLTAFTSAAHSLDGRTLYLGIESQGGACGQYEVVLQQSGTTVGVGLVHLPAGGRVCPMYVTHMLVEAKLSAPLERRRVIDLANGQTVASPQVG